MTGRELFRQIVNFEKPDRPLFWEFGYWPRTILRWQEEGLDSRGTLTRDQMENVPTIYGEGAPWQIGKLRDRDVHSRFRFDDGFYRVPVNVGFAPAFDTVVLEDRGETVVVQDEYGGRHVEKRDRESIPHYLSWAVANQADFDELKESRFRIDLEHRLPTDWDDIVRQSEDWDGPVVLGGFPYGFFGYPRFLLGAENLLVSFYTAPRLVKSIIEHLADLWIFTYDRVLADVKIDAVHIWEDMCFKTGPLISPEFFREFLLPAYARFTGFLRDHGVRHVFVDTDGECSRLISLFLEGGVTGMYPFECASGMDITRVREVYPELVILGGLDKRVLAAGRKAIDNELERKLPAMFRQKGYVPFCDHLVPPDVPFGSFVYYRDKIVQLAEKHW